jgi:hypothetical protein
MVSARGMTPRQREVAARVARAESPALLAFELWRESPPHTCVVCWRDKFGWTEREDRPSYTCSRDGSACARMWRRLRHQVEALHEEAKRSLLLALEPDDMGQLLEWPPPHEDEARRAAA